MKQYLPAALAALMVLAGLATTVHSDDRPASQRIAFVDVRKAFETYRKHRESMEQIDAKGAAFLTELKARVAKVEEVENGKLVTLNPGTPEYAETERQIAFEKYSIDFDRKQKRQELEGDQRRKRALIYKEICTEAGALAQEKGYAAVSAYIPPDTEFGQDLDLVVLTRDVLWRDEQFDVTEEVVKRLNAQLPPPAPPKAPGQDDRPK